MQQSKGKNSILKKYTVTDLWTNKTYQLKASESVIFENSIDYSQCKDFITKNIPALKTVKAEATYLMWVDVGKTGMTGDEFAQSCAQKPVFL